MRIPYDSIGWRFKVGYVADELFLPFNREADAQETKRLQHVKYSVNDEANESSSKSKPANGAVNYIFHEC